MIAFPDEPQASKCQHFVHARDVLTVPRDELCEPTRSDNLRLWSELMYQSLEDSINEADITVVETYLNIVRRACADNLCRLLDFDASKTRRACKKCVGRNTEARRNRPAEKSSLLRDNVEGCRGSHVHDNRRTADQIERSHAIHDAVGADLARIVGQHRQARLHTGLHEERPNLETKFTHPP